MRSIFLFSLLARKQIKVFCKMVNYSFSSSPESWHFEEIFTFQQTAMTFSCVSLWASCLTQQCVVTPFVRQEAAVHCTYQQVLREGGGLYSDQHEPRGHIQGIWCQRGQTQVSACLTETCGEEKTEQDSYFQKMILIVTVMQCKILVNVYVFKIFMNI